MIFFSNTYQSGVLFRGWGCSHEAAFITRIRVLDPGVTFEMFHPLVQGFEAKHLPTTVLFSFRLKSWTKRLIKSSRSLFHVSMLWKNKLASHRCLYHP